MSTLRSAPRGELRGWHVLAAMLAFFAAVIAVNVAFMVVALDTFPGEDVRRSYVQGIAYNQTLEQRRNEEQTGWRAFAELAPDGAAVQVTLSDSTGAPLRGARIDAELRRPAAAAQDVTLAFNETAPGVYSARIAAPAPGVWIVRGAAKRDGAQRSFERRLQWRP